MISLLELSFEKAIKLFKKIFSTEKGANYFIRHESILGFYKYF